MKRLASYYIVLVATGLVFYHSYQAWYWITSEWYSALGWSLLLDSLAIYLWFNKSRVAWVASTLVVLIAFFHLSANVTNKIDLGSNISQKEAKNKRLEKIGEGASKYGNHDAVNKVLEKLDNNKIDDKGKIGTIETIKMISLIMAVYGQVYAIKKLLNEGKETKPSKEDDANNTDETTERNVNTVRSIEDLAKLALKELNQCRVRFGGVSEAELVGLVAGVSKSAFSKARNTLNGETDRSKSLGDKALKLMIHRLRSAKPSSP